MFKTQDYQLKVILFVLAFALYANTIGHSYAWDDSIVITENPYVKKGFYGIPELFVKHNSDYKADKYGYRPITLLSFAIEYGLFKESPKFSHFMNLLYFAILCLILFNVLKQLFYQYSNLGPFLITLIFMAHPVHTEVVANIKSRDEILALLFSLLSLQVYLNYLKTNSTKYLFVSGAYFILGFLSKESALSFAGVLALVIFYAHKNSDNLKQMRHLWFPVLLFFIAFIILKLSMNSSNGKETSQGAGIFYESGILGNSFFYTDLMNQKIANALLLLILYLKNFLWPVQQLYFYGFNQIPVAHWQDAIVLTSLLLHLFLIYLSIYYYKKKPEISFGLCFYFIGISFYLHVFRTLADTMADRFLFTPSLGMSIALVFALLRLFKIDIGKNDVHALFQNKKQNISNHALHTSFKYLFIAVFVLLSLKTISRNKVWKNTYTLISTDMPHLEKCARAHNYMADELKNKLSQNFEKKTEIDMIEHYLKSIEISNESYYAYLGLGRYYLQIKKYDESIVQFKKMIELFPNAADPLYYMGDAYLNKNEANKAIPLLEKSLQLAPEVLITYLTLSTAYAKTQNFEKAIQTNNMAKSKFGESAKIYETYASIYFEKNDLNLSSQSMLETIRFGADAQLVYKIIIGRLQFKKQDSLAAFFYNDGRKKGIFGN